MAFVEEGDVGSCGNASPDTDANNGVSWPMLVTPTVTTVVMAFVPTVATLVRFEETCKWTFHIISVLFIQKGFKFRTGNRCKFRLF